jgi:predicted DNA-binding protein with PD1-like motif
MQYSEAKQGRIFVLRLEDGETVHTEIEKFARLKCVSCAAVLILGGADKGSQLVVGPKEGRDVSPVMPLTHILNNVHEVSGTGTIFPNKNNEPILHLHMACGREGKAVTGCIRSGVKVWHVMEVIIFEIIDSVATRQLDTITGFELLKAD